MVWIYAADERKEVFAIGLISVVVPCYNEREALPFFYRELAKISGEMKAFSFELIFIDDGSTDRTLSFLKELRRRDPRVKYISFSRNFGKEAAMLAGLRAAKGDFVAVMDADMQDPPNLLPGMLKALRSGEYDCVAVRRISREGEPKIRSFFARLFYRLINRISNADIVDGARDFRLMTRQMTNAVLSMQEVNRFSKGIFGWIGFRTKWVEYRNVKRVAGETKWSFWKLFLYAIEGVVAFSTVPLAISSAAGMLFCTAAFVMAGVLALKEIVFEDPAGGWLPLACMILFTSGVQLFCMGILGQYLAKTYLECKRRPAYLVRQSEGVSNNP